ncbi:hypothetical protein Pst134EA_015050 [Puccinia striiformis f. sp. tritici]|uniref:hypothetical protein n=1 Tax=Puccinia striiformis f. sp. tritici TaxID=168172 RepID=UPI0020081562|nr:hypothetical protein Pst134EA_015050 [Puccinia striiformis f. sp. tritici]KAH9462962.1 hypothetical protein Pst134EA_015050 [Puccinia striiformis f. sp. tritici]
MQITATIALCLSLFIFQLADSTQGMFSWLSRAPKTTAEASGSAKELASTTSGATSSAHALEYWTPPIHPKLSKSLDEYQTKILNLPDKSLPPLKPQTPISGNKDELFDAYRERRFNPDVLSPDDPRKIFLQHILSDQYVGDYQVNLIQMRFKSLFQKATVNNDEVEQWFEVLFHALKVMWKDNNVNTQAMAVSALYGAASLRMKVLNNEPLIAHIDGMSAAINRIAVSGGNSDFVHSRWAKEILTPKKGFSNDLGTRETFLKIFANDRLLVDAMSENVGISEQAIRTLGNQFDSASAYRRVITLAVYHHQGTADADLAKLFLFISISKNKAPHETRLIKYITDAQRRPR